MPETRVYTKEEKIQKEARKLKKVYTNLDKNKLNVVESLIKQAAFMAVSLEELQELIDLNGYQTEYQNGENQFGTKKNPDVDTYNTMSKNYAAVIKILADLAPPVPKKDSRLAALKSQK